MPEFAVQVGFTKIVDMYPGVPLLKWKEGDSCFLLWYSMVRGLHITFQGTVHGVSGYTNTYTKMMLPDHTIASA